MILNVVKFMATKKGEATNFVYPLLFFVVVGSGNGMEKLKNRDYSFKLHRDYSKR